MTMAAYLRIHFPAARMIIRGPLRMAGAAIVLTLRIRMVMVFRIRRITVRMSGIPVSGTQTAMVRAMRASLL